MKTNLKILFFLPLLAVFFSQTAFPQEDMRLSTWTANLKNENPLLRKSSAKYLGLLGDRNAVPYLVAALNDENPEVRSEVCNALGLLGDEGAKDGLTRVLESDSSQLVKNSAKRALDNIESYLALQQGKKLKEMKEKLKAEQGAGAGQPEKK